MDTKPEEQQIIESVGAELDDVIQIAYVDKYANTEMKAQIQRICEYIIAEYRVMLSECIWHRKNVSLSGKGIFENVRRIKHQDHLPQ